MAKREINRIRVVLAEKGVTNKWLAEKWIKIPQPYHDGVIMRCNPQ